ncbi:MAG: hypothetical protein K6C10_01375 [Prevotella sp.]|nr:hypothetical protein [Prevotella sp.]
MKKLIISFLLLLSAMGSANAQLLKGDMNDDGQVSIADVTYLVNVILGKTPMETIDVTTSPFEVDNSILVGTWYAADGSILYFNEDSTTNYRGISNATYAYYPAQSRVLVKDASGNPLYLLPIIEATSGYFLTMDYTTGEFSYYYAHYYVDLGLPSGTKWASCNIGASQPEYPGSYFAWGETTGDKKAYSWATYKYCEGTNTTLTKYCSDSSYGTVDNLTGLEISDDAAYVNWGNNWRIPSKDQWDELETECTWTAASKNGWGGFEVTGPNGNTIFLPNGGEYAGSSTINKGSVGYYWSRTVVTENKPYQAYYRLISSQMNYTGNQDRCIGMSIRPVWVSN